MFDKRLSVNFTECVATIEVQDDGEKVGVALQFDECDSLAAAIDRGANFWLDDERRQFGFSNLIVYVSAAFIVLGVDKSKLVALALRCRANLEVKGT